MGRAATVDGSATVRIGEHEIEIRSSNFLDNARASCSPAMPKRDPTNSTPSSTPPAFPYFADYLDQATAVPDPTAPAQPSDNRPYRIDG